MEEIWGRLIYRNIDYGDYYEQDGENYYIKGFPKYYGDRDEETDVKYLDLGYVTVTPLTFYSKKTLKSLILCSRLRMEKILCSCVSLVVSDECKVFCG